MTSVDLVASIASPTDRVWARLADLGSHTDWMTDAESVEFVTDRTSGVGTQIRVLTRVGPLRTTDHMTVIEWEEGRSLAVRHDGAVRGVGRFEIRPSGEGTEVRWSERLEFPWWLGAALGETLAKPILMHLWQRNLGRLRGLLEVSDL